METITREMEAPERAPAFSDRAAPTDATIDGRGISRPTPTARRELQGCARGGCLEVAKLGSHHCPLHE
jgi:hypothetical protein